MDDDQIFIADTENHRIIKWKFGTIKGEVVAGGNEPGNGLDQLNQPTSVVFHKETDSLIICDCGNERIMRWFCKNRLNGEILISNIRCCGLVMDNRGYIYVSDTGKDVVRRYRVGNTRGTIVAGGSGRGDALNQLNWPTHLFIDHDYSLYISDTWNNRVMKWGKDAKEGIVVAGGRNEGNSSSQLSSPKGLFVDQLGTVYVADGGNHRVMAWRHGMTTGDVIIGGNGRGQESNRLADPEGLSFDQYGNMYVVDWGNDRVQRFLLEQ